MISAYPLQWPKGWPRTKPAAVKHGKFTRNGRDLTIADSVKRVLAELVRMGVDRQDIVISTNVPTRLDGLPKSGEHEPNDSGAAVYWQDRKREKRVMAIDLYSTVYDNLAAIAATLDAMRAIERHGGAQILDRAFTGFAALPAPSRQRTWREVMELPPSVPLTMAYLKDRYRNLASIRHPDKGGSHEGMVELNAAYEQAQKEIGR
jgi:hypothetical protein